MEHLSRALGYTYRGTTSFMNQQLDNESRRNAFLNEATFEKEWLEFERKNGIYEEFIHKKRIIDGIVKHKGININVHMLMALIDKVTLKNMRCLVNKALSNGAIPKLNFQVSGRISVVMSIFSVFGLSYGY